MNNYSTSPNGFWYRYTTKESLGTKPPVKGDELTYTYEIKDVNNEILYTREELGDRTYLVDREELISGLQDGLKLMKVKHTFKTELICIVDTLTSGSLVYRGPKHNLMLMKMAPMHWAKKLFEKMYLKAYRK